MDLHKADYKKSTTRLLRSFLTKIYAYFEIQYNALDTEYFKFRYRTTAENLSIINSTGGNFGIFKKICF